MPKQMVVCPHDTAKNKVNWIEFVSYLSEKLDRSLSYAHLDGFRDFQISALESHIAYANPIDALRLWKAGYQVVAGNDVLDSAIMVKLTDSQMDLTTLASVRNTYAHLVGLKLLIELNVNIFKIGYAFKDSWDSCVKAVLNGEVPAAILYKDYWDGLSNITKSRLEVIKEGKGKHSHYIMLKPNSYSKDELLNILINMPKDPKGAAIMQRIHIKEWIPKDDLLDLEEDLNKLGLLESVLQEY